MARTLFRPCAERPAEHLGARLQYGAGVLYVHGLLTPAERERVRERMLKRVRAEGVEPKWQPIPEGPEDER